MKFSIIIISSLLFQFGCGRAFSGGSSPNPALNSPAPQSPNPPSNPSPQGPSTPTPPPTNQVPPTPTPGNLGPTQGKGGTWGPGQVGRTEKGAYIYIPKSYKESVASSVIFLLHIPYQDMRALADAENIILVDTEPPGDTTTCKGNTFPSGYINQEYILQHIIDSRAILVSKYNIDLSHIYIFGWSHGGDIAMKFTSLPTADTVAPEDSAEMACTSPPATLLPLQKAAHVGQAEIAGVLALPGHYGRFQINLWKQANKNGTRRSCFGYLVGDQDDIYTKAYDILMPELNGVPNYKQQIYFQTLAGWGHDLISNSSAISQAWQWLKKCDANTLHL